MGIDAGTPPGLVDRIRVIVREELAKFARSGFLRNASISDGGLTIRGGFLRLLSKATGGVTLFYIGPSSAVMPNGEYQQYLRIRRADGTTVLQLWDSNPGDDGTLNQALSWLDRSGNVVFADDTDSGQGIARPYLPIAFYPARNGDWVKTTSTTFDVMHRAQSPKQQPRLIVKVWVNPSTPGTAGELRVMVNGTQLGAVVSFTNDGFVHEYTFGPLPVEGAHMSLLIVEIQARRTAGTGEIQVAPSQAEGRQT